jgi:undecaprenyl-diphosphatase
MPTTPRSAASGDAAPRGEPDPIVGQASPEGWKAWALRLLVRGRRRLAGATLALLAGFLLGLGALFVFADLAEDVMEREYDALDSAVLSGLRGYASPALDVAAQVLSLFGSEVVMVVLIFVAGLLALRRRWGAFVSLLVVTGGAQLLNDVLKDLFQRTRPAPVMGLIPAQQFSFPSGHAMVSAAFYLFLAYLAWRLFPRLWSAAVAVGLIVLVLLIGLSRLYLGVHYFTDVVAGYVAGFIWTDAVILSGRLLDTRPWRRGRAGLKLSSQPLPEDPMIAPPRSDRAA